MGGTYTMELSEQEMRHLAEMAALLLSMLSQAMPDLKDPRAAAWQRLCVSLLGEARELPSLSRDMELNPDCGYWFFKRAYVEKAFYSDVLDEYRDASFWEELVSRLAQQSLEERVGPDAAAMMSDEERARRSSSMEKALWNEVTRHGLERLLFMISPNES